jgi:hypothetical protein
MLNKHVGEGLAVLGGLLAFEGLKAGVKALRGCTKKGKEEKAAEAFYRKNLREFVSSGCRLNRITEDSIKQTQANPSSAASSESTGGA